jgi:hypothetical protein
MLHTTVTARARRTRCAHAQLAPTDFSDTCLSAHCLRPPPGRTHSPPTVALALLERSQRLPKPPTPPLPRPRRDPPAADRALPPQQRCLEPRPNAHSNPPEETPPPDANDATAACAVRVLRRCHARCGSRCAQTAAPSRAPSPQHCTQLHPGALTNGRHSSTNFSIRCLSGEARQDNAYLDNKRGAAPVDKSVCHSWRLQLEHEESSGEEHTGAAQVAAAVENAPLSMPSASTSMVRPPPRVAARARLSTRPDGGRPRAAAVSMRMQRKLHAGGGKHVRWLSKRCIRPSKCV